MFEKLTIERAKNQNFKSALVNFYNKNKEVTNVSQKSENWELVLKNFEDTIINSGNSFYDDLNYNLTYRNDYSLLCHAKGFVKNNIINYYMTCLKERGEDPYKYFESFQESCLLADEICANYDGYKISSDYLRRITHLSYIEKKFSFNGSPFILEIGAGHGGLAKILKSKYQNSTYCIIDLPETLYFSMGYLMLSFPDAKVLMCTKENLQSITQELISAYDFIFMPIGLEKALEGLTVDLFINTHSFGEIPPKISQYWFDFFQNKIKTQNFFMINRFLNRRKRGSTYDLNICSTGFDRSWYIEDWEVDPKFMRGAQEVWEPRYLLISGSKIQANLSEQEYIDRSHGRVFDVYHEPWYDLYNKIQSGNYPELEDEAYPYFERNLDMSRTSSIYRCWDAARLNPCKESLELIIKKLRYLAADGAPYNEEIIYRNRLNSI